MMAHSHRYGSWLAAWLVALVLVGSSSSGLAQGGRAPQNRCRFGRVFDGKQCVWPQAGQPVPCVSGWTPVPGGCTPPAEPPPTRPADVGGRCETRGDCEVGFACVDGSCRDLEQSAGSTPTEAHDGPRFRGAMSVEGGAFIVPDPGGAIGAAGIQAEVGVQVNDVLGIYFVPGFGGVFAPDGGAIASEAAVVLDVTAGNALSIGAGPEVSVVGPGVGFGGRVHLGLYPDCGRGEDGVRRKAFTVGADVRFEQVTVKTFFSTTESFVVQPTLLLGYTAF